MSVNTVNYFHQSALKQRYLDALDWALLSERLRTDEHLWLKGLDQAAAADEADPVRVDRLMLDDG